MQARPISFSVIWNTSGPQDFTKPLVNGVRTEDRPVWGREKEIIFLQPIGRVLPVGPQQLQQRFGKRDQPVPPVLCLPDRKDAFFQINIPAAKSNRFRNAQTAAGTKPAIPYEDLWTAQWDEYGPPLETVFLFRHV